MKEKQPTIVLTKQLVPPNKKAKIKHFISRKAMNIDGLGPGDRRYVLSFGINQGYGRSISTHSRGY